MADWRLFKFDPANTPFARNYNWLRAISADLAVAYATLPRSDTNGWKRSIDAYAKSTTLGNVLIGVFTEPSAAPWERCPGAADGWRPPSRPMIDRDGKTFVANGQRYTLPEVNPEHVRKRLWWQ